MKSNSGSQQAKDISSSVLTTSQDSKSRVNTVSHDPSNSSIQASETNLPQKKESPAVNTKQIFKVTAHGVLQWIKEKGSKQLPKDVLIEADSLSTSQTSKVKKNKGKRVAKKKNQKLTKKTGAMSKVAGLDLPALDEDYNMDSMTFLQAQRIFEVKVIENHLEVNYTNGRERELKLGGWESFHVYDLERINALLNYEDLNERFWKTEIAKFLKLKAERDAELWRLGEEKRLKKEKEMEEMEKKAKLLREKGLCRVKFNPYVVEYKNPQRRRSKLTMDYLDSYVESYLQATADDLKDSPLVEEMEARCEILLALANMKTTEETRRKKAYDDLYLSELDVRLKQGNIL